MTTRKWLTLSFVVALALLWVRLIGPLGFDGPASYVLVSGHSMEPTYYTGDLVVTLHQATYQKGDIVAYRVGDGHVIHRIVGGDGSGYSLQGVNNDFVDPWHPTAEDVLGKAWLHVPGAGSTLQGLRQPQVFGMLAAAPVFLIVLSSKGDRRRRKGGRIVRSGQSGNGLSLPAPTWAVATIAACGILALAFAGLAVLGFRPTPDVANSLVSVRYQQTVAFDYAATVTPSTIYPSTTYGPVVAGGSLQPTPLFTKLARGLDVGIVYTLKDAQPADVAGDLAVDLQVMAGAKPGDGWAKSIPLQPSTPFSGNTASTRVIVDLDQIWLLIGTIEKETGYSAGSYSVAVVPTVHVRGNVGGEGLDDTYSPSYTFKLSRVQITPDAELTKSDVKKSTESVSQTQSIALLGLIVSVAVARTVGLAGAIAFLVLALGVAAYFALGFGLDEPGRIRARHRSLLVAVAKVSLRGDEQRIQVASFDDLASLAKRDGRAIFHQEEGGSEGTRTYRYFVQDGQAIYEYTNYCRVRADRASGSARVTGIFRRADQR